MGPEPLVAAAILAALVVALFRELAPPAAAMLGGLVLFVLVGILPPERAFVGFSSPATVTVAGMFVVARTVRDHAGLEGLTDRLLGDGSGGARGALVRLVPPVAGLSGVMNNTPLVAALGPIVRRWAERHGVAATQLLVPLSFAAILGGLLTLIGTGPNLVVSGTLAASGHEPLGFFTITAAGLPLVVVGGIVLVVFAPLLLPDRRSPHERLAGDQRHYTIRLTVVPGGPADGVTVAEAGLRDLATTYLATILRRGHEIAPVAPDTLLEGGDDLVFVGRVSQVRDLLDHPGLVEAEEAQTSLLDGDGHGLVECVVSSTSPLAGTTLKTASFRGRYGGAVVAIHRAGERIDEKLGGVTLRAGDALLVLADVGFAERWQGRADFAVVVPLDGERPDARDRHGVVTLATLAGMVVLAGSGVVPVVTAVLAACSVLVVTRAIRFRRALDSLDLEVLLIIASAIGLGAAMEASGLAQRLADAVGALSTHRLVALAAVVVATMLLTELVTNAAAAGMMVPVAIASAELVGADPTGFAVGVAVAASSSFLTPIGYQTNTIVYGLGGYRFGDYWRLGLPLAATTVVTTLVVIPRVWG